MKWVWRVLGWLVAVALAAYFLWLASRALDVARLRELATLPVAAVTLVAALLYACIIPVTAWAWKGLLAQQGEAWKVRPLAVLLGRPQLAKYIPGNVAQHVGRAFLSLRAGMGMRAFAVTVVQENVLAVAASVLVGLIALALSPGGLAQLPPESRSWLWGLGLGLAAAVVILASFNLPPHRLAGSPSRLARALARVGGLPGPKAVFSAFAAYSLNYVLIGLGLWLLARAAGMPPALDLAVATAVFALSWLLGFLAPGAPAGLGVREGIMVLILAETVPDPDALAFVLLARVVTLAGDAIIFVASHLAIRGAVSAGGEQG
jgi:uncharacterized membrane protein YbhN (UPF0104 family)